MSGFFFQKLEFQKMSKILKYILGIQKQIDRQVQFIKKSAIESSAITASVEKGENETKTDSGTEPSSDI